MRLLESVLRDQDQDYIKVLVEQWGIDPTEHPSSDLITILVHTMLDVKNLREYLEELPEASRRLFKHISSNEGRVVFSEIERNFGGIREMGPARRDREKPWRSPTSPVEDLWYRGLISRAFADTSAGPREFIYIPDDLLTMLPKSDVYSESIYGKPTQDPKVEILTSSTILDDATTLIAALRKHVLDDPLTALDSSDLLQASVRLPQALGLISTMLLETGILEKTSYIPHRERAMTFLESSRFDALKTLMLGWRDSQHWNDLQATPRIHNAAEKWPNDPTLSRTAIVSCLQTVPIGQWWSIDRFASDMRLHTPDFQRPGGDYDSWYLQNDSGQFLHGYQNWENVEGALIRYVLNGPLFWLGAVDLGRSSPDHPPYTFRRTRYSALLFGEQGSLRDEPSDSPVRIQADGKILAPFLCSRMDRYQVARISDWEKLSRDHYVYRITPESLELAQRQELKLSHIMTILETASKEKLPPSIKKGITRWFEEGLQAKAEKILIIQVSDAEIIEQLQSHKSTSRYLGKLLSPTIVEVRNVDWPHLRDAAARRGLLISAPSS